MARGDTRERIQQVARELFAKQGVARTSLQEIAARVGITKPALYYHFASREELVRSIIVPILEDGRAFLERVDADTEIGPRALLEGYFDVHLRHRDVLLLAVREAATLDDLGLIDVAAEWRERLAERLVGADATLARRCSAIVALGGLADCAWTFQDVPEGELIPAAVDAACVTLGIPT